MHFFAKLNPNAGIHRDWRTRSRISGLVSDVLFRWDVSLKAYVSDELPPEAIESFRSRQDKAVLLETLRVLPEPEEQQVVKDPEQQSDLSTQQVDEPAVQQQGPMATTRRRTTRRRLAE